MTEEQGSSFPDSAAEMANETEVEEPAPAVVGDDAVDGRIVELTNAGLPVGSIVVNMVRRNDLDEDALRAAEADGLPPELVRPELIREGLAAAGLDAGEQVVEGLQALGRVHIERMTLEIEQRRVVDKLGRPVVELPMLNETVDLGSLYELAEELYEAGFT